MSEIVRMSIVAPEEPKSPQLETTTSELLRLRQAALESIDRVQRLEALIAEGCGGPRHVALELAEPTAKEAEELELEQFLGYKIPDASKYRRGQQQIYDEDYRNAMERIARRDERMARNAAKAARGDKGFAAGIPVKIAKKRAEGTVRVEPGDVKQNETKRNKRPRGEVTESQRRAILMLLIGKSDAAIAYEIGVARWTVWRWRQSETFRVALFNAQKRVWGAGLNKIRAAAFESVGEMRKQMKDKSSPDRRFRAAQTLIHLVGQKRLEPTMEENIDRESYANDAEDEQDDRAA